MRLEFAHDIAQRLLVDDREEHLADGAVRLCERRFGQPVEQTSLIGDDAEVTEQLLHDLLLGAVADALYDVDQHPDEDVDELSASLDTVGGQQGVAQHRRVAPQLVDFLGGGALAIESKHLRGESGEEAIGHLQGVQALERGDLATYACHTDASWIGFEGMPIGESGKFGIGVLVGVGVTVEYRRGSSSVCTLICTRICSTIARGRSARHCCRRLPSSGETVLVDAHSSA